MFKRLMYRVNSKRNHDNKLEEFHIASGVLDMMSR